MRCSSSWSLKLRPVSVLGKRQRRRAKLAAISRIGTTVGAGAAEYGTGRNRVAFRAVLGVLDRDRRQCLSWS